jgi:hypothetical protein
LFIREIAAGLRLLSSLDDLIILAGYPLRGGCQGKLNEYRKGEAYEIKTVAFILYQKLKGLRMPHGKLIIDIGCVTGDVERVKV